MLVVARADAASTDPLALALEGQLVDLPVTFEIVEAPPSEPGFGARVRSVATLAAEQHADLVVWFEREPDERMFVFLSQTGHQRTLVRELSARDADSPHAVALLVRSVAEALVHGGRIGVEVPTPPPAEPPASTEEGAPAPAPTPTPVPAPPSTTRRPPLAALLDIGYRLTAFAREAPVTHSIMPGAELLVGRHASVFGRAGFTMPMSIRSPWVDVDLRAVPIALGGRAHARLGRRWEVGGRLAVQLEIVRRRVRARDVTVDAAPTARRVLTSISPAVAVGLWVSPRVRLGLEAGVDATVRPLALVVAGPEGDLRVLQTFGWRPFAGFRVGIALGQPVLRGDFLWSS